MADKPFLSLVPYGLVRPLLRPLRRLSNLVVKFFPTLRHDIKYLDTKLAADDFIALGWFTYVPLAILLGYGIVQALLKKNIEMPRALTVACLAGFAIIALFTFVSARHPASVMSERAKQLDKYLLYALRDLSLQLQSGETVFKGMVAVAYSGYSEVSTEFMVVVRKVNAGIPLEHVLQERVTLMKSEYLKKAYWQILNNIHSGSDLRGGLQSIIQQLNNEQKTKIQNYARELNLWSLVYMLFAVAIPTIGSTMLVILSTFASFGVSEGIFILFIVACFIVQTALIVFVKSRRPVVQF